MVCPKCGSKVSDGDSFCTNCGTNIVSAKTYVNDKQQYEQKESILSVLLYFLGVCCIVLSIYLFISCLSNKTGILYNLSTSIPLLILGVILFSLGYIVQKVTEIHQHHQNKSI